MDRVRRDYYELKFKVFFMERRGDSFQEFFSSLMEKRHPGDFQRMRPWGNVGDKKSDGYLKSTRSLFQCYAPNEMAAKEAIKKIDEDFVGALHHWGSYFDVWVFVHNSMIGLGPDVEMKLIELERGNPPKRLINWGYEELRLVVFELGDSDLVSLLGYAPSLKDFGEVGYDDVQPLLDAISLWPESPVEEIRPVPPRKIQENKLSPNVESLLRAGMSRSDLLKDFFGKHYDPTFGDRLANAFRAKYIELKEGGLLPDIIFHDLQKYIGGEFVSSPGKQAAVLVVLAYFFETCDIFERPKEDTQV